MPVSFAMLSNCSQNLASRARRPSFRSSLGNRAARQGRPSIVTPPSLSTVSALSRALRGVVGFTLCGTLLGVSSRQRSERAERQPEDELGGQ